MRIHQALFIGFTVVLTNQALAQTTDEAEVHSEKCQAQPQDQEEGATATNRSLTETLDDCIDAACRQSSAVRRSPKSKASDATIAGQRNFGSWPEA